jgi:hypothetical protein
MRGGGGRDYRASTPIVDGQTIFIAGRGIKALKLEKDGDKFTAREVWSNPDTSVQFNTPVLKDGMLYGLTQNNQLFCINAKDGKTSWTTAFPGSGSTNTTPRASLERLLSNPVAFGALAQADTPAPNPPDRPRRPDGPGGPGGPGGRRGGGMGGGQGYGSLVDAGSVLLALTPSAQLIVFEPSDKELKQVASYKVASGQTHAYPVASGNRIIIKDKDSLTLWTVE